ncbi:DUF4157 domain-containing protein, partial [Chloroflexota bacterium]
MSSDSKAHDHHEQDAKRAKPQPQEQIVQGPEDAFQTTVDPAVALQRVMSAPPGSLDPNDILSLQRAVGNKAVQRLIAQHKQMGISFRQNAQQNLEGDGGFDSGDDLEARINAGRTTGEPLAEDVRQPMEQAFGADFSGVSVHTGPEADALNQQLSAKAFTTGPDIFFKHGAYDPASSSGGELIAHELTHVVQQGSAAVKRQSTEVEAEPGGSLKEEQTYVTNGERSQTLQSKSFKDKPALLFKRGNREPLLKSEGLLHIRKSSHPVQEKVLQRELTEPGLLGGSKETSRWGNVVASIRRYNRMPEESIGDVQNKLGYLEAVKNHLRIWRSAKGEGSRGVRHREARQEKRRIATELWDNEIPRERQRLTVRL